REGGLRKFELSNVKWMILEQLRNVLKVLKDAMLFFSCVAPNLAAVIPAMDILDREFTSYTCNHTFSPAVRAAVSLTKQTLNRYYSCTDSSEVYQIAMILHPRHKLTYFKNAHWEADWIDTA
ncbi:hypothetical protein OG21DRAFT_1380245, partial [Imleria badia]